MLPRIATRTRVVFLQHPRERRKSIGTARMAHLALENSELRDGVSFENDTRVRALVGTPGVALLFPGEGAESLDVWQARGLTTLVVVDGTWPQARKIVKDNPLLASLPRVGFVPRRPSNYRIRKEPAEHCVSTVEAVVEVLALVEGDEARFEPLLAAFAKMIDQQIDSQAARVGPPRNLHRKRKGLPWRQLFLAQTEADVVLVHVEANSPEGGAGGTFVPELVQVVAERLSTGERFHAFISPVQGLSAHTPYHLGLPPEGMAGALPLAAVQSGFAAFFKPTDVACVWGAFASSSLAREQLLAPNVVDVRRYMARLHHGRPGELRVIAKSLPGPEKAWAPGRAGPRLAAFQKVFGHFRAEVAAHVRPAA